MIEPEPSTPQPVSKVFELRQSGADTRAVVEQLFFDEYQSGLDNPELRYIGLRTLIERDQEGEAALRWIAKDTGRLGNLAQRLLDKPPRTMEELEQLSGLRRYHEIVEGVGDVPTDAMKLTTRGYEFGKWQGFIAPGVTFNHFAQQFAAEAERATQSGRPDEADFMSFMFHFRAMAPTYYAMLDFDEIHRLQTIPQPRLVLLGASHRPSADGFNTFAESVNPSADRRVLELDPQFPPMGKLQIDRGNALQMPYADASVDHVYTNALLHQLIDERRQTVTSQTVQRLLKEIFRVLKPHGQCLLLERPYGRFHHSYEREDQAGAFAELRRFAQKTGFEKKYDDIATTRFMFRRQEGTAHVSRHGIVYYPDALLYRHPGELVALRLEKPAG